MKHVLIISGRNCVAKFTFFFKLSNNTSIGKAQFYSRIFCLTIGERQRHFLQASTYSINLLLENDP